MDVIDELEILAIKVHGSLLDVCEAWVVKQLISDALKQGLISKQKSRKLTNAINEVMAGAGEFPI